MEQKYLFYILFFSCLLGYGQSTLKYEDLIPKLIQSPNAASLNKFIEFPVNNFNGTVDVSFPLYEIKLKNLSVPITLKYHTGGIRVNEEASWVGLGWALDVGGQITHQINGNDDNDLYSKYHGHFLPYIDPYFNKYHSEPRMAGYAIAGSKVPNETGQMTEILSSFTQNSYDSEPDLYMYHMGSYSGKYFINHYNATVDLSNNNIDIKHYLFPAGVVNQDSIIVTTPDGCKYKFKDKEISINVSGPNADNPKINSYLLSEIITPDGEKIKFIYKSFKQIYTEKHWEHLYSGDYTNFGNFFANAPSLIEEHIKTNGGNPGITTENAQKRANSFLKNLFLEKIEFPGGVIEFEHGDRNDNYNVKLNKITVKNSIGNLVKFYDFNYDYFLGNSSYGSDATTVSVTESLNVDYPKEFLIKRLKLLSFSENGSNGLIHKFNYNENTLPYKTSFSQDFWGYFNGKSNKTLLPSYDYHSSLSIPDTFRTKQGANRDVDTTAVKAGILKEIIYPTGGKTDFEFESNECINSGIVAITNSSYTVNYFARDMGIGESQTEFTIDTPKKVDIYVDFYNDKKISAGDGASLPAFFYAKIEKKYTNNIGWYPVRNYSWDARYYSHEWLKDITLEAGTYRLTANYPDSYTGSLGSNMSTISVQVYYENTAVRSNNYVGGLRIKQISHSDTNLSPVNSTIYSYKNGVLATNPVYSWSYPFTRDCLPYENTIFSTSSVFPFSFSANGSLVGYRNVTKTSGNGEIGRTEYEYSMESDNTIDFTNMPPGSHASGLAGIPTVPDLMNGSLKSEKVFSSDNVLLNETIYKYKLIGTYAHWAFKNNSKMIGFIPCPDNGIVLGTYMINYFYPILQGRSVLEKTTKTEKYGNIDAIKTTTYNYNLPYIYFPTSIEETRSDGGINRKDILYSSQYNDIWNDLNPSQRGAFQNLVNQNRITPIQESSYANNEFISSSRIYYKNWSSSSNLPVVSPESIGTKNKGQASYETQATFNNYDLENGNVLESQKKEGIPVAYIWGYNKTLLVAKIENANYSSISPTMISIIQTASNTGTEQELLAALKLLRDSLPNAMITTYTHLPLVGVKSITDSRDQAIFYHYDGFNRLEYVTDHEGNVLNKNAYNYQKTNP
nr:hypothetical protein [uncultured Flavobacterium sp.]